MSFTNNLQIIGNLTREPELRYTATGGAACTMSVAVNRRWTSKSGEQTEVVSFFSVATFGAMAENAAASLAKGDRVVISGRVDQRSWTDEAGGRHTSFEVVADEISASLRFCTATLTKVVRSAPSSGATGEGAADAADTDPFGGPPADAVSESIAA